MADIGTNEYDFLDSVDIFRHMFLTCTFLGFLIAGECLFKICRSSLLLQVLNGQTGQYFTI